MKHVNDSMFTLLSSNGHGTPTIPPAEGGESCCRNPITADELAERIAIEQAHDDGVCVASLNGRRASIAQVQQMVEQVGPREWRCPEPGDAVREPSTGHIRVVVSVTGDRLRWKRGDAMDRFGETYRCSIAQWREWCLRVDAEVLENNE